MHFFYLSFCSLHVHETRYNVNIKNLVCQIIGPAAAGSAGPVPTPVIIIYKLQIIYVILEENK